MTPFLKFIKRTTEKLFGKWDEDVGPEPPKRLREYATTFANRHPNATRAEWLEAMSSLAEEAYRTAFQRGYEHSERAAYPPAFSPDQLADQLDPGWKWSTEPIDLENPLGIVPDEEIPEAKLTAAFLERATRKEDWNP